MWAAFGGAVGPFRMPPPPPQKSVRASKIHPRSLYAKEERLLAHVLANAAPGDAESVCDAIERFGEDVVVLFCLWVSAGGLPPPRRAPWPHRADRPHRAVRLFK